MALQTKSNDSVSKTMAGVRFWSWLSEWPATAFLARPCMPCAVHGTAMEQGCPAGGHGLHNFCIST